MNSVKCRVRDVLAALIVSSLAGPPLQLQAQEFPQAIGEEIEGWIEHGDLVGAEVLIFRDGQTLHHRAYGWDDRETRTPLRTDLIYSLASLTKPVTALAVLMLVEEGVLSLDDRVSKHIPTFRGDPRATVHDLLAQTSGDGGGHGNGAYNVYDFETLEDWVEDWAVVEATAEYGEFTYSNFNYAALALISERASGVPFGDFVTRRILEPLGMSDTYVSFSPDSSWADRVATSYTWDAGPGRYVLFWAPDEPQRWTFFPAAFGLWGTAADYAKFVTLWLDLGVVDGHRVLSEATVRAALAPQGSKNGDPVYGYGWFLDAGRTDDGLPFSFRHSGGRGTYAVAYPGDRTVVLYFTQSEIPPDHHRAFSNRLEMSGFLPYPGPDMMWASDADIPEVSLGADGRAEYAGLFRGPVSWGGWFVAWEVEVTVQGDFLQLSEGMPGSLLRQRVHLVPIGDDSFAFGRYEEGVLVGIDPPARARFLRVGDRVAELEVSFGGEVEFVLERSDGAP